jgi:hypothetical protein
VRDYTCAQGDEDVDHVGIAVCGRGVKGRALDDTPGIDAEAPPGDEVGQEGGHGRVGPVHRLVQHALAVALPWRQVISNLNDNVNDPIISLLLGLYSNVNGVVGVDYTAWCSTPSP